MINNVGDNIKKLRELKGLSREYLAEKLDLHITSYGNIERGQADITVSKLFKIADLLKVNPVDILNFTDKYNSGNVQADEHTKDEVNSQAAVANQLYAAISRLNSVLSRLLER